MLGDILHPSFVAALIRCDDHSNIDLPHPIGCKMFIDKLSQLCEVSFTIILLSLHTVLVNIKGWESINTLGIAQGPVDIIGSSTINMTNKNIFIVLIFLGKLFPGRSKSLTMSTPWCKELDKSNARFSLGIKIFFVQLDNG